MDLNCSAQPFDQHAHICFHPAHGLVRHRQSVGRMRIRPNRGSEPDQLLPDFVTSVPLASVSSVLKFLSSSTNEEEAQHRDHGEKSTKDTENPG